MFKTEKHLRQWLMKHIPGHWQPIELSQGVGVPDLNYCVNGREGWAELKVDRKSPLSLSHILRPAQYAWMVRRANSGGRVQVIIGMDKDLFFIKDLETLKYLTGYAEWSKVLEKAHGPIPATKTFIPDIIELL